MWCLQHSRGYVLVIYGRSRTNSSRVRVYGLANLLYGRSRTNFDRSMGMSRSEANRQVQLLYLKNIKALYSAISKRRSLHMCKVYICICARYMYGSFSREMSTYMLICYIFFHMALANPTYLTYIPQ